MLVHLCTASLYEKACRRLKRPLSESPKARFVSNCPSSSSSSRGQKIKKFEDSEEVQPLSLRIKNHHAKTPVIPLILPPLLLSYYRNIRSIPYDISLMSNGCFQSKDLHSLTNAQLQALSCRVLSTRLPMLPYHLCREPKFCASHHCCCPLPIDASSPIVGPLPNTNSIFSATRLMNFQGHLEIFIEQLLNMHPGTSDSGSTRGRIGEFIASLILLRAYDAVLGSRDKLLGSRITLEEYLNVLINASMVRSIHRRIQHSESLQSLMKAQLSITHVISMNQLMHPSNGPVLASRQAASSTHADEPGLDFAIWLEMPELKMRQCDRRTRSKYPPVTIMAGEFKNRKFFSHLDQAKALHSLRVRSKQLLESNNEHLPFVNFLMQVGGPLAAPAAFPSKRPARDSQFCNEDHSICVEVDDQCITIVFSDPLNSPQILKYFSSHTVAHLLALSQLA